MNSADGCNRRYSWSDTPALPSTASSKPPSPSRMRNLAPSSGVNLTCKEVPGGQG